MKSIKSQRTNGASGESKPQRTSSASGDSKPRCRLGQWSEGETCIGYGKDAIGVALEVLQAAEARGVRVQPEHAHTSIGRGTQERHTALEPSHGP